LLDEEALHIGAGIRLLAQVGQLLGEGADVALVVAPEEPELRGDVLVLAGLDRLVVGLDGVHVEMEQVLQGTDAGHCSLLSLVRGACAQAWRKRSGGGCWASGRPAAEGRSSQSLHSRPTKSPIRALGRGPACRTIRGSPHPVPR